MRVCWRREWPSPEPGSGGDDGCSDLLAHLTTTKRRFVLPNGTGHVICRGVPEALAAHDRLLPHLLAVGHENRVLVPVVTECLAGTPRLLEHMLDDLGDRTRKNYCNVKFVACRAFVVNYMTLHGNLMLQNRIVWLVSDGLLQQVAQVPT